MARLKLGLLGGTFDPIHTGHLLVAEFAREQLNLDRIMFMPAGDPWRKASRDVTAAEHRVAMVGLAIAGNDTFIVDGHEVMRDGPTYTVDTLRSLRAELDRDDEIYLVLGEDALADLPQWREPSAILAEATLAVVPRLGGQAATTLPPDARAVRVEMPFVDISSSLVRERVANKQSIRYLVPDSVAAYIEQHGLYRA